MKNLLLLISALIVIGIIACRKHYAEDDSYTLKSPFHRLTKGKWIYQKVEIDGVDSTTAYLNEVHFVNTITFNKEASYCDPKVTKWDYYVQAEFKYNIGNLPFFVNLCPYAYAGISYYSLDEKKAWLTMTDFAIVPYTILVDSNYVIPKRTYEFNFIHYSIRKLTDSELILEADAKNRHFRFTFTH
jgi:hypothetical protein